jgi:transcriptional regulator with XRE-family HTH domain
MKLEEYLSRNGITQLAFAEKANIHPVNISQYINGRRIPKLGTMIKIREATNGAVDIQDFAVQSDQSA